MINTAKNTFSIYDTTISFVNNTENAPDRYWNKYKYRHYGYFYQLINMLGAEGFNVCMDPDVDKIWYMKIHTAGDLILINSRKCHT